ncbi:MAG: hypothetical protein KGI71_05120, partial [Patescibacteria group bacterium]|nr:hypothetical protein [Patescibacteria group bacterium]
MPTAPAPQPAPVPQNAGIIDYLYELLQLGPGQVGASIIELGATLGTSKTTDSDKYLVPTDRDLIVYQMQGGWRSTDINSDITNNGGTGVFNPSLYPGLIGCKLENCTVQLLNMDRHLNVMDA